MFTTPPVLPTNREVNCLTPTDTTTQTLLTAPTNFMQDKPMPKLPHAWDQVQAILDRQAKLLDELRKLAPKECIDDHSEGFLLMTWQSALLALDDTLEPLEELAWAAEHYTVGNENQPSDRRKK
jgi:hypothetical protein